MSGFCLLLGGDLTRGEWLSSAASLVSVKCCKRINI